MARTFSQTIRRIFQTRVPERISPFVWMPPKEHGGRGVLFTARVAGDLSFFIYVTMNQSADAFTLEVAWNTTSAYPFSQLPDQVKDDAGQYRRQAIASDVYRSRINALAGERRSFWWSLNDRHSLATMIDDLRELALNPSRRPAAGKEADQGAAASLVDDACQMLERHGLPLFDAVAEAHGRAGEWKSLRSARG